MPFSIDRSTLGAGAALAVAGALAAALYVTTSGAGDRGEVAVASGSAAGAGETAAAEEMVVYRSPACGCCLAWVEHMREAGFRVRVEERTDLAPVKAEAGVPADLSSCHTAVVGGYVVEGHVPAADVRRLLAERPDVHGLAVPGMPVGSPGMEGPRPDEPYEVIAFDGRGDRRVFARH